MSAFRTAIEYERGVWVSLYRWILRRPPSTDRDAARFGYSQLVMPVMFAFIGVSIVEIPILHFLLPWRIAQIIAWVISIWGLLWMLGFLGALRVYVHLVGGEGLRVRSGFTVDVAVPWPAVKEIRRTRPKPLEKNKTVQFIETADGGLIGHVAVMGQTNVEVVFTEPTTVDLPRGPLTELRFWADEPDDLVAAARTRLAGEKVSR